MRMAECPDRGSDARRADAWILVQRWRFPSPRPARKFQNMELQPDSALPVAVRLPRVDRSIRRRHSMRKLLAPVLLVSAALLSAGSALAQDWPTKPVKIVVPYPPGGNVDGAARIIAMELQKSLGQP